MTPHPYRTRRHVALAAIAFALCYGGVIVAVVGTWATSYVYSYGFAVPLISAYILWTRSDRLRTLPPVPDYLFGVPVTLAAIATLAAGHLGALISLQEASMVVTLAGFILLLFGRRVFAAMSFPLSYLLLGIPIWDSLISWLRLPSQILSGRIAVGLLHSIGVPAFQDGTFVILPRLTLEVLPECSGVNQLIAIVAMALPAACLWLHGYKRRITLVGIAVAVAYLTNGFRIAVVGFLGNRGLSGGDIRVTHLLEGLAVSVLGYILIFGCLYLLARVKRTVHAQDRTAPSIASTEYPKRVRLSVEVAVLAIVVAVGALPFLFRPADVRLSGELRTLPGRIAGWTTDTAPEPVKVRFPAIDNELVHAYPNASGERSFTVVDDGLLELRTYRSASGQRVRLYIGYHRYQEQGKGLAGEASHALGAAASPLKLTLDSETIEIDQIVQSGSGTARGVFFWYDLNGRIVANMYLAKGYMVWDALTRRRTNGAVVMVAWECPAGVEMAEARQNAIDFVRGLLPLLRRYIPS